MPGNMGKFSEKLPTFRDMSWRWTYRRNVSIFIVNLDMFLLCVDAIVISQLTAISWAYSVRRLFYKEFQEIDVDVIQLTAHFYAAQYSDPFQFLQVH